MMYMRSFWGELKPGCKHFSNVCVSLDCRIVWSIAFSTLP